MCLTICQILDVPCGTSRHWPYLTMSEPHSVDQEAEAQESWITCPWFPNNYVLTYKFNPMVCPWYNTASFLFTRNQNVLSLSLTSTSYFILDSSHPLLVQVRACFWKSFAICIKWQKDARILDIYNFVNDLRKYFKNQKCLFIKVFSVALFTVV